MEIIAKRNHLRNLIGRLAKAAEYDFLKARQIAQAVRRRHYLFGRGFAVTEPQIVAVIAAAFVSYAEIATVGAFVGKVDIQIAVQNVYVGIFAVILLRISTLIFLAFILVFLFFILVLGI